MSRFLWKGDKRYNDFSGYFRRKFEGRVQKISIDAGFTCPNRDGSRGIGGCSYCNNQTFSPAYCNLEKSVTAQLNEGIEFFARKYNSMKYLAYFQSYSNTYAPVENLKMLYEEALVHPQVIGLVIATRPDCLSPEILDYLQLLAQRYYIMLEFGIESHKNVSLEYINRGHTFEESIFALQETARRKIHNCAHLILGLPGESKADCLDQARIISKLPVENLKLHQLQIHKNTRMYHDYLQHPEQFPMFTIEGYLDLVVQYLELLNPAIVVERFVSEAPDELLVAPRWGLKNFEFTAKLEKLLEARQTWQGRLFEES
ncbi:MAG TPA: TIGR01212 family radical SAM protein [Prolixibacteraceae bacterium]|jgi:radical SAM protein (TIGR01212 family)|nr:TIGR01212 family radical SAM protein [Prolixibacteraceae bacterium]